MVYNKEFVKEIEKAEKSNLDADYVKFVSDKDLTFEEIRLLREYTDYLKR